MRRYSNLCVFAAAMVFAAACGNKDKGGSSGTNENNFSNKGSDTPTGFGNGGVLKPTANFTGAGSLFVVDPSQQGGTALIEQHNKTAKKIGAPQLALEDINFDTIEIANELDLADGTDTSTTDGTDSLLKEDSSGEITEALTTTVSNGTEGGSTPTLPKVLTLAVSPAPYNEIFVHFENAFRFKEPTSTSKPIEGDQRLDGTFCQLFRVKGGDLATLKTTAPTADNLECLDFNHFINNWNAGRLSVFQFDTSGNVYYPGGIPNSPKVVVYKWDRTNGALTEMINSNICVQDFLVTKTGGMFYTGTSSCNGGGGPSNGGFFRYLNSSGLIEIARNWYNFIYEPSTTSTGDQAVFFGPDPTTSSTASWNSACLFKFDPAGGSTMAARTSSVITCGNNIWDWIQMNRKADTDTYGSGFKDGADATDAYKTEFSSRCTSSGQIFAGGGSQISAISQDSTGQVYVIGNVRKKNAGTVTCAVEVRGPHCKNGDGDPDTTYTTSSDCTTAGGTWVDSGYCSSFTGTTTPVTSSGCFTASGTWNRNNENYSSVKTKICTASGAITQKNWWSSDNTKSFQTTTSSTANTMKFRLNNMSCQPPNSTSNGDQWTSEYQGLGKVNSTALTLSLLSGTDEQAIKLWVINDVVYYSSFNSTSGHYLLRMWDGSKAVTMVDNFETYHLNAASDSSELYYDGLDFSDNTYNFGTILKASPYTRNKNVDLTGALKMVVLMP